MVSKIKYYLQYTHTFYTSETTRKEIFICLGETLQNDTVLTEIIQWKENVLTLRYPLPKNTFFSFCLGVVFIIVEMR